MIVVLVLVVVLLIGATAAAVAGRIPGSMSEPTSSHAFEPLPEGRLQPDAVGDLLFDQALRGYRMDQVDAVIGRLTAELRARDEELAAARGQRPAGSDAGLGPEL